MKTGLSIILALALAISGFSVSAHHSFAAQYDINQPIILLGKVTKVEWTNPHARFYVDVTDASGTINNWNIEMGSPNFLKRAGWSRNDLQIGDEVTVNGSMARSGADMANAASIILKDGKQVFGRNAADDF
ncbi:MAG: DUF6152 family protein [Gammaproteobacteria bacterium]|nr:DUF6152 family protein [Gammaproteobacteria bacterium]